MASTYTSIHLDAGDVIAAKSGETSHWIDLSGNYVFGSVESLTRLRDAVDACIAAQTARQQEAA
ncbi:MAG: hypothetical protein WC718_01245 [Phycisphaerales bacterium]|jgi:hypothetical protein